MIKSKLRISNQKTSIFDAVHVLMMSNSIYWGYLLFSSDDRKKRLVPRELSFLAAESGEYFKNYCFYNCFDKETNIPPFSCFKLMNNTFFLGHWYQSSSRTKINWVRNCMSSSCMYSRNIRSINSRDRSRNNRNIHCRNNGGRKSRNIVLGPILFSLDCCRK